MSVSQAELDALLAALVPTAATLTCTVCGERLDKVHRDIGTHPMCDPGEMPSSTISELRGILIDYEANSPRTTQTTIGPSEIGVACDRRLAYRAVGTPQRPDGRVKWAPMLGTAIHATIADALLAENASLGRERWLVETRVHPDETISGSCDAYDTDADMVVDWKLVGPTRLEAYRRKGPGVEYERQIHIYGRGWQRAGRTPRWVRIVFLPRSTDFDEAYEWTEVYDPAIADEALARLVQVVALTRVLDVAKDPSLWAAVPATPNQLCAWCPFFRRGAPADATGCPGDVAADARRDQKFTEGLIAS